MDRFLDRLDAWATGRVLLGLLIGMFAIGATLFLWVAGRIAAGSGGGQPLRKPRDGLLFFDQTLGPELAVRYP